MDNLTCQCNFSHLICWLPVYVTCWSSQWILGFDNVLSCLLGSSLLGNWNMFSNFLRFLCYNNRTNLQYQNSVTDVSVTLRPPCLCPSEGHKHGVSIESSINLGDTLLQIARANEKQQRSSLILGEVVYMSIIYRISDALLISLNGYDF